MSSLPSAFLLSYVGFTHEGQPFVDVEIDGEITRHSIMKEAFSHSFDMSQRHCTGWVDFEHKRQVPCPDSDLVDAKYDQCVKCRNRAGFNPAFYNATSVSKQQEAINQQPHFVYLAYFCPGLIKVGISQESRGARRLLEQGARAAIKLETFPSALIARQYEAKIASLSTVVETVTYAKKAACLTTPIDEDSAVQELLALKDSIEAALSIHFEAPETILTGAHFNTADLAVETLSIMKDQSTLLGTCTSVIGSTLILEHESRLLAYNLKSFVGHRASAAGEGAQIELPSEQMMLF